jgi:uridine phosphorylase
MEPYVTPNKLLAGKKFPINCDIAIICLCPLPKYLEKYKINIDTTIRFFIHLHPYHVMFCNYDNINFIVCSEVYGGPVVVSIVEELKYYGVKSILSVGFVGSLNKKYSMGSNIRALGSLSELGTTPHYDKAKFIMDDGKITNLFDNESMEYAMVWTTNAIYREYKNDVEYAINNGCDVVNMDTSHFFAACKILNISCAYFATVSDALLDEWDNNLTTLVKDGSESQNILINTILKKLSIINDITN